jgi:hypothetical protein
MVKGRDGSGSSEELASHISPGPPASGCQRRPRGNGHGRGPGGCRVRHHGLDVSVGLRPADQRRAHHHRAHRPRSERELVGPPLYRRQRRFHQHPDGIRRCSATAVSGRELRRRVPVEHQYRHGQVPGCTACSRPDPLGFDLFGAQAHSAGASTFVTVDYGSGTPAEASQWVAHAGSGPQTGLGQWEVGNESYSCYEANQHLAGSPTFVQGYTPGGSVCPSTKAMARSYAVNALPYLQAMKGADPGIRIGVPWAFSGAVANGAGVSDADTWNAEILHALGADISFVDAHWYPFDTIQGVGAPQILSSVRRIPSAADHIRSMLHRYAPGARFTVGETNISERPTTADFGPVSALFAAATSLEWLSAGAVSIDWWDLNNYGAPTTGDFGLLSSGSPETAPTNSPFPPYYGEVLASTLTAPGSRLRTLAAAPSSLLGFESDLHGQRSVLLVNAAPNRQLVATPSWFRHGSLIHVETYSAATSTGSEPIVGTTASSTTKVPLPAESIVVLSGTPKSS